MPGTSGGRRLEGELRRPAPDPLLHPRREPQQRRQVIERQRSGGKPAPGPARHEHLGKRPSGWPRKLDTVGPSIAFDRLGHRRAAHLQREPAGQLRERTRIERLSWRCGKGPPRGSMDRGRPSRACGDPRRSERSRSERATSRLMSGAQELLRKGRGRSRSRRESAIRCSSAAAGRAAAPSGPAARSRSCARPGDSPASTERGDGPAAIGALPARPPLWSLGNRKDHIRAADLLQLGRADVIDVGHPLTDATPRVVELGAHFRRGAALGAQHRQHAGELLDEASSARLSSRASPSSSQPWRPSSAPWRRPSRAGFFLFFATSPPSRNGRRSLPTAQQAVKRKGTDLPWEHRAWSALARTAARRGANRPSDRRPATGGRARARRAPARADPARAPDRPEPRERKPVGWIPRAGFSRPALRGAEQAPLEPDRPIRKQRADKMRCTRQPLDAPSPAMASARSFAAIASFIEPRAASIRDRTR